MSIDSDNMTPSLSQTKGSSDMQMIADKGITQAIINGLWPGHREQYSVTTEAESGTTCAGGEVE